MDFTIKTYRQLLATLLRQGFSFQTFADFIEKPGEKVIVLRHDVDRLPENSLVFAEIESGMGIKGTYYFRTVPESWNEEIIKQIAGMGHEIGYHYEDVSLAAKGQRAEGGRRKGIAGSKKYVVRSKKDNEGEYEGFLAEVAIESFTRNLDRLRQIVPVKTICMHGSPLSRWDSRLLWKYYDYRNFGIIGEPYFDLDFDKVLYLTDTGRRWDGDSFNIRDKAEGGRQKAVGGGSLSPTAHCLRPTAHRLQPSFHSTFDIIKATEEERLPPKVMMTFHPQRWTDKPLPWVRELVWQNVKNSVKYLMIRQKAVGIGQ